MMSVVDSLVLPNLSVQVWWPGEPELAGELFERVVAIGDRIIVDSSRFADPLGALTRYDDRVFEEHGNIGFADLSWRRLEPWRLFTAQFFDSPADRVFLNDIQSVVVGFEGVCNQRSGLSAALFFVGWLASRLGWTLMSGHREPAREPRTIVFDDGGRSVRVELRKQRARSTYWGLVSVEIVAQHDQRQARYTIERFDESGRSVAETSDGRREARVSLPARHEVSLLQDELAGFGRDRIFEDALAVIGRLGQTNRPASELT